MSEAEITENAFAVVEAILKKIPEPKIKTIYVKTTMGKPAKVGAKAVKSKENKEAAGVQSSQAPQNQVS
jgi:hypothetical protein